MNMNLIGALLGVSVNVVLRKDVGIRWNAFVDQHDLGTWWYRQEWLDYCLAYRGGTDLSFIIVDTQHPEVIFSLVPLIVEGTRFALGGNPCLVALMGEITNMQNLQAVLATQAVIEGYQRQYGIRDSSMMLVPTVKDYNSAGFECDGLENIDTSFATRMIDLTQPLENRWAAVRKSYHQLIRRGREKYQVWKPGEREWPMETYADLHRGHYGPIRSAETYALQSSWMDLGVAQPYIITENGVPVGAILWYVYKGRAYYASGVYLEDNIAHMAVWESLTDLAAKGVQYAEMGWQGHAKDQKGQAVEFFKRGFGGEDWPVKCLHRIFGVEKQEANA